MNSAGNRNSSCGCWKSKPSKVKLENKSLCPAECVHMDLLLEKLMLGRTETSLHQDGGVSSKRCTFPNSCSPRAAAAAHHVDCASHEIIRAVHYVKGDAVKDHRGLSPPKLQSNRSSRFCFSPLSSLKLLPSHSSTSSANFLRAPWGVPG